ncbi:UrcA family protein [Erythrobacter alti]|uniref:UrcA family protein n=1 Tax=Erythrobacter alti TaxID=1896145 RepID=UPI0030F3A95E
MFTTAKLIAAASVLALAGTAANASDPEDIIVNPEGNRMVIVEFGDLNLQSEAGRDTLEGRIRGAVRVVCGHTTEVQSVSERTAYRQCSRQATSTALASIDPAGPTRVAVAEMPARPGN